MQIIRPDRFVLALALASALPLAAQSVATEKRLSNASRVAPFTCPAPQLVFQAANGKMSCIAPDANPCPPGQALDKGPATRVATSHVATCKPLPAKTPFACPAPQLVFQAATGKMTCIAPDANPCPQGQVLDTTTKPGFAGCKPAPFTCPAPQTVFQGPDGKMACLAPDANPCTHGTILDKSVSPARCKPAPFACPAPQLAFQAASGKMTCIAPDANPCPTGQILDTTTKPGSAVCKPAPARAPLTCPAGQIAVQQATGRWVCVAKP